MNQSPMRPYPVPHKMRIWGGDGEGEGEGQGSAEGGDTGNSGAGDGGSGDQETAEQKQIKALEKQNADLIKKHKDEKKRADDAEAAQIAKDREGMEEHERTAAERDDFKEKYEKLLKVVETSVIDTAIRNLSSARDKSGKQKYDWQDVEAVRVFLDKSAIKLDLDTGDVEGLESQLSDLAKKKPYLLVPQQDPNAGGTPSPQGPATGLHPFGGQTRQRETDRQKLGQKYKLPGYLAR